MELYYYPQTIKKVVVALSDMFNNLTIQRRDDTGNVSKTFKVPFTFGPVNKYQYIRQETGEMKKYYLQLPRVALTLDGFNYSQDRATGVNELRYFYDNQLDISSLDEFYEDVQPTPWDLTFNLHIRTEAMDDFCQIVENILPYFNPALYLRIKEFDFLNVERDLQVIIQGLEPEFTEIQEENEKREVNGIIPFTVAAWMYRPISNQKVIKEIQTRYFISTPSGLVTSGSNLLVEQYNTSGFGDVSAVPSTSAFSYSGTFNYSEAGDNTLGYYATSAQNFS